MVALLLLPSPAFLRTGCASAPAVGPIRYCIGFGEVFLRDTRNPKASERSLKRTNYSLNIYARSEHLPCTTAPKAVDFRTHTAGHSKTMPPGSQHQTRKHVMYDFSPRRRLSHLAFCGVECLVLPHEAPALALLALQLHLLALALRPIAALRLGGNTESSVQACADGLMSKVHGMQQGCDADLLMLCCVYWLRIMQCLHPGADGAAGFVFRECLCNLYEVGAVDQVSECAPLASCTRTRCPPARRSRPSHCAARTPPCSPSARLAPPPAPLGMKPSDPCTVQSRRYKTSEQRKHWYVPDDMLGSCQDLEADVETAHGGSLYPKACAPFRHVRIWSGFPYQAASACVLCRTAQQHKPISHPSPLTIHRAKILQLVDGGHGP